uniref:FRIGIDA-like protein n=1 Tax=Solanum chacoense TaxID=4108 RepID=A0A0V0IH43_SOLCH
MFWYSIIWIFTFGYQLFASVGRQVNFWCPQEIRSSIFMEYIPKLIQWGVKGKVINAIDIAYAFGFEEKLDPLGLLTSFLKESEETLSKKIKGFKQTITVRAAKKRYLFDLKSVYGCLKRHRIDPSKLVPGWQFNVKIMSLEQEIAELNELVCQEELAELVKDIRDQKMAQKRKIDETESSGCFSNKEMKNSYFPNPRPPHQQKVVNHVDNSNTTLLEGGGAGGHIYGYSLAPSILHAPVAGSIHENVIGSLPGPVGGVAAMGGAGASKSVQGGSCAGVHGLNLVDSTPGQIGSHTDRLASHSYAYRPLSYLEGSGSMGLPNSITVDAYRSPPYWEASTGLPSTLLGDAYKPPSYLEASTGLSNTIPADAYRPPPYLKGSMRLPNTTSGDAYRPISTWLPNTKPNNVDGGSSTSDTYQFADTVPATEQYRSSSSRAVDAVPSAAPAHPSSYLYW